MGVINGLVSSRKSSGGTFVPEIFWMWSSSMLRRSKQNESVSVSIVNSDML